MTERGRDLSDADLAARHAAEAAYLADALDVDVAKVTAALDSYQTDRQAERTAALEDLLAERVDAGTLTQSEADAILAAHQAGDPIGLGGRAWAWAGTAAATAAVCRADRFTRWALADGGRRGPICRGRAEPIDVGHGRHPRRSRPPRRGVQPGTTRSCTDLSPTRLSAPGPAHARRTNTARGPHHQCAWADSNCRHPL